MLTWFRRATRPTTSPARRTARLGVDAFDALEDRITPSTAVTSAITSNFNGTAIAAGNYLWFNSVAKVSGVTQPTNLHVTNGTITFNAGSTPYTVSVPDSTLTLTPGPSAGPPNSSFTGDLATGAWTITTPYPYSGNVFLAGAPWLVPAGGIPGGSVKSITWSADFSADQPGVSVNWQWSAAVYTQFSTDPAALMAKPSDAKSSQTVGTSQPYNNSDHAGTPEAFKTCVVGGARGGGGSNYTGSYSATGSVVPTYGQSTQAQASLSGFVTASFGGGAAAPQANVTVTLSWTDAQGSHSVSTTTDANGMYSFNDLAAGSYTITETPPDAPSGYMYLYSASSDGKINGVYTGDGIPSDVTIDAIDLGGTDVGTNYDFVNYYQGT